VSRFVRRSRRIIAITAVAVAALITVGLLANGGATRRRPAPALPRAVLHGPAVTLAALRGHPALIVFWASWCGPCHAEAPAIERFARSAAGRGRIVGIADGDDTTDAHKFITHYGWTFPVLSDPHGTTAGRFGLLGLPTTIVLDGQGQIVRALLGPQTAHDLDAAIATA
jgi:cytochrome c biogenesis protein CcmG/thiol:disulfide interchange protein DsbE